MQPEHSVVYAKEGEFAGWPANNGIWKFADGELVVGLIVGPFEEKKGHNMVFDKTIRNELTSSKDGGRTWTRLPSPNFVHSGVADEASKPEKFNGDGFMFRARANGYFEEEVPRGCFFVSHDRGRSWSGSRGFGTLADHPELEGLEITARTDYLVENDGLLVMMSARIPASKTPNAWQTEKVFCARTKDAVNFEFVSWVVPRSNPYRAVMPATVRVSPTRLVTTVRRRQVPDDKHWRSGDQCWIDAYVSNDNARSWSFAARVADTGAENGNPPAVVGLPDGRLCCVFGNRDRRDMNASYGNSDGTGWSSPQTLRNDFKPDSFNEGDLGYPRLALNAAGELVATYYWADAAHPHQYIAATIWRP